MQQASALAAQWKSNNKQQREVASKEHLSSSASQWVVHTSFLCSGGQGLAPLTPPPEVLGRPAAHPGPVLRVRLQPTHGDAPRVHDRAVVLQNTKTQQAHLRTASSAHVLH